MSRRRNAGATTTEDTAFGLSRRATRVGRTARGPGLAVHIPDVDITTLPGYDARLASAGLLKMLRELPRVLGTVLGLCFSASRRWTVTTFAMQIASAALTGFVLLRTTAVFAALLGPGDAATRLRAAVPALLMVTFGFALRGAIDAAMNEARSRLSARVRQHAENELVAAALEVDLASFEEPAWYEQMSRARSRELMYVELAVERLLTLVSSVVGLLAVGGVLTSLHPVLLPMLILTVLPDAWAALRGNRLAYVGMFRYATLRRRQDIIDGLTTARESAAEIRACGAQEFLFDSHLDVSTAVRVEGERLEVAQSRLAAVGRAVSGVALALAYGVLWLLLTHGDIPLAGASTAAVAISMSKAALSRLTVTINQMYEQGLYITDLKGFIRDAAARRPRVTGRALAPSFGQIKLHDVTFGYPGVAEPVLRRVSLDIPAGSVVALVGENGSGKSTLAKLIAGLYTPQDGNITWDGVDVRALDAASIQDNVALIAQDGMRWPLTARQNITIGRWDRADPDEQRLTAAVRESGAGLFLDRLPAGLDTVLSRYFEDGHDLSGGQWQTMAIARGIYRDAPLLICDEPTASLDPSAEYQIYQAIRRLAGPATRAGAATSKRTVVLITHRLASVRLADRIYVLHRGEIVEQGTHDELLAAGGRYADYYTMQASGYQERDLPAVSGTAMS